MHYWEVSQLNQATPTVESVSNRKTLGSKRNPFASARWVLVLPPSSPSLRLYIARSASAGRGTAPGHLGTKNPPPAEHRRIVQCQLHKGQRWPRKAAVASGQQNEEANRRGRKTSSFSSLFENKVQQNIIMRDSANMLYVQKTAKTKSRTAKTNIGRPHQRFDPKQYPA